MRTLIILNPAAGHGRGEKRWAAVEAEARRACPELEVRRTRAAGHASELAREALTEGFERLLAVGGDGTLGEALEGFLAAERPEAAALGTWPVGSGCDMARHLGVRQSASSLLGLLRAPVVRRLDAGKVEYQAGTERRTRFFLNIAAVGLAGDVALSVQENGKAWGGTLTYLVHSLVGLARARAKTMTFDADGVRLDGRFHLAVLANTSTFGGGMKVAPAADAEDGLLDLVTVGDVSRAQLLRRFPSIYAGRHLGAPGVEHRLARRVSVTSPEAVYLNIDGEAIGSLPATFEVLPGAVPFLCPT